MVARFQVLAILKVCFQYYFKFWQSYFSFLGLIEWQDYTFYKPVLACEREARQCCLRVFMFINVYLHSSTCIYNNLCLFLFIHILSYLFIFTYVYECLFSCVILCSRVVLVLFSWALLSFSCVFSCGSLVFSCVLLCSPVFSCVLLGCVFASSLTCLWSYWALDLNILMLNEINEHLISICWCSMRLRSIWSQHVDALMLNESDLTGHLTSTFWCSMRLRSIWFQYFDAQWD